MLSEGRTTTDNVFSLHKGILPDIEHQPSANGSPSTL